ncbi:MAG: ERAP1-like C-terminal domain-containing protein, partial [Holophagales bacterium]|nr:ERAP1-like C-terminal domain-containing protein [Holophagales bacterium]
DGWKTVRFRETPPTPSYLLAIATGPLDFVEFEGMSIPGRLYTVRGKTHLAGLALEVTPPILRALEEYFGSPYPYAKLDFLAVPDKGGAMENPGAVTYGDGLLLLEPGAGPGIRRAQAGVVAHELAHMWFGDWVTMAWWDDLWLNEAFASWMGDKVAHALHPELGIDVQHRRSVQWLMNGDTLLTTRPVRRKVESTLDISEDLGFAYGKGQSILSLVEQWVGEGTFRKGVIAYLEAHAWGNARAEDLWRALDRASGLDVTAVMKSFLEHSGLPLITVVPDAGGRLLLRQTRFLRFGMEAPERRWSVPMALAWGAGGEVHQRWMLLDSDTTELELGTDPDWLLPDSGAFGYHRWLLPREAMLALADEHRHHLSAAEKVASIGNAGALLQGGILAGGDYLRLLAAFSEESEPVVLQTVVSGLSTIESAFLEDGDRELWARVIRRLLSPRLAEIGYSPQEDEIESVALLRPGLMAILGGDGRDPEVRRWAAERARAYLHEGTHLPPDVRRTAIRLAAVGGDEALFRELKKRFEAASTPGERSTFLGALGRFEDPDVQRMALAYVLEGPLRVGELMTIPFTAMSRDDASRLRVFDWMLDHWSFWQSRLPEDYLRFFPQVGATCSLDQLERLRTFFGQEAHQVAGMEKALVKVEERVRGCVRLRDHQRPSVLTSLERLAAGS